MKLDDLDRQAPHTGDIQWVTATFMAIFHIGAIAALFFFSWKAFFVATSLVAFHQRGHRHGHTTAC